MSESSCERWTIDINESYIWTAPLPKERTMTAEKKTFYVSESTTLEKNHTAGMNHAVKRTTLAE